VFYQLYILLSVCLACTLHQHAGGGKGIPRKYRNPKAQSTRSVATQICWWDVYTKTMHQQLLQLFIIIQEH